MTTQTPNWRLVQVDRTRFYIINDATKECVPARSYFRSREDAQRKLAELQRAR